MGTRSLTRVIEDGETLVTMYRQYDGYPEGHGKDLAKFLKPIRMVNGIDVGVDGSKVQIANGAGCLAAQLVGHFKKKFGVGGIYIVPSKKGENHWQEYEYDIVISGNLDNRDVIVNAYSKYSRRKLLFSSPASGMVEALKAYEKKCEAEENE